MLDFNKLEAIILDKDGVFVDFHKLWLRIIAHRAQSIAELASDNSPDLVKIRSACIRAMGVDEDDESIDPFGPCTLPVDKVRLALATALYLIKNEEDPNFSWTQSFNIVDEAIRASFEDINVSENSESFPGVINKIKTLSGSGFTIGVFTSDGQANTEKTLEKFKITKLIKSSQTGEFKTTKLYKKLCTKLQVKPEATLMVSDAPHDLAIAKAAGAQTLGVLSGVANSAKAFGNSADQVIEDLSKLKITKTTKSTNKKIKTKTKNKSNTRK